MDKEKKRKLFKRLTLISVVILVFLLVFPVITVQAADTDGDGLDNINEDAWVNLYAPTLIFKSGENFYPVDVSYHIDNSVLKRWVDPLTKSTVDPNPTIASIGTGYTDQYFLDNALGNYSEILADYTANRMTLGYTYYAHVFDQGDTISVQYWFFYAYNDHSVNQHEGDWEVIEVLLNASASYAPYACVYSQHYQGAVAAWADVEKTDTTHPTVYVAKGSHANYFRPYEGKLGLASDEVGNDGFQLTYDHIDLTITHVGEIAAGTHLPADDWLDFQGRWGDWFNYLDGFTGFAGPYGPGWAENEDKFENPQTWETSAFPVGSTWFAACWFMYYLLWIVVGIFSIIIIVKLAKAIKTRSSKEDPGLGTVLGGRGGFAVFLGLIATGLSVAAIFIPWYIVYSDIQTVVISAEGNILLIDGLHGLQMNFLVTDAGMSPVFGIGIPFYIFLAMGAISGIVGIFGVKKAKSLGTSYILSGIFFFIMVIILILLMSQIGALVGYIEGAFGIPLPTEATDIMNAIAAAPVFGDYSTIIPGLGTVDFTWGFEMGAFLLMGSAGLRIFGGAILRTKSEF